MKTILALVLYGVLVTSLGWIPLQGLSIETQMTGAIILFIPVWAGLWLWWFKTAFKDITTRQKEAGVK